MIININLLSLDRAVITEIILSSTTFSENAISGKFESNIL